MTKSVSSQFTKVKNNALKNISEVQRAVFFEMSNRIIQRTPVDTGRARANWQADVEGFKGGVVDAPASAGGGTSKAIQSVVESLSKHRPGQALTLGNNLEYVPFLENGSSQQAPQGMVALTVAEFKGIVEVQVRGIVK